MASKRQALLVQFLESSRSLVRMVSAGRERCFKRFKLHPAQVGLLYFVMRRGSVTMREISEAMDATGGAATQMVEGMVKLGYLDRRHDPKDRRVVHVALSRKGITRFERFRRDHLERLTATLAPLSDEELSHLIRLQEKVRLHVDRKGRV